MVYKNSLCYMADRVLYDEQSMVYRVFFYGLQSVEWWIEGCVVNKHRWCYVAERVLYDGQSMVYRVIRFRECLVVNRGLCGGQAQLVLLG